MKPFARPMMWAGPRLTAEWPDSTRDGLGIGEILEASGLADMPSTVVGGPHDGKTLEELYRERPDRFVAENDAAPRFPLLVKRIDAGQDLSIQVHPDDEWARKLEREPNGKSEAWVILEAIEGAEIHLGFADGVGEAAARDAVRESRAVQVIRRIPVSTGDVIPVPAGCIHAIGSGIYVFEVQQTSNVTYRLHDYDRPDPETGLPRKLHLKPGVKALKPEKRPSPSIPPLEAAGAGSRRVPLCNMGVFRIERWVIEGEFECDSNELSVLFVVSGRLRIAAFEDSVEDLAAHETLIVPAHATRIRASSEASAELLVAIHPSKRT